MVHEGLFATSAEILARAGENYDTSFSEAMINDVAAQSESIINVVTRINWSDTVAAANNDIKRILSSCSAAFCAMHIIAFNMAGFTSRTEAEDMVNVQRDSFLRDLSILRDQKSQTFMVAQG